MNKHNKHYRQLTQEPRYQISALRKTGMKVRAIALEVGVHFSTLLLKVCHKKQENQAAIFIKFSVDAANKAFKV